MSRSNSASASSSSSSLSTRSEPSCFMTRRAVKRAAAGPQPTDDAVKRAAAGPQPTDDDAAAAAVEAGETKKHRLPHICLITPPCICKYIEEKICQYITDEKRIEGAASDVQQSHPTPLGNAVDLLLSDGRGCEPIRLIFRYLSGDDLRALKCVRMTWLNTVRSMWQSVSDRRVFAAQPWYRAERWSRATPKITNTIEVDGKNWFRIIKSLQADEKEIFCSYKSNPSSGDYILKIFDRATLALKHTLGNVGGYALAFNAALIVTVRDVDSFDRPRKLVAFDRSSMSEMSVFDSDGRTRLYTTWVEGVEIIGDDRVVVGFATGEVSQLKIVKSSQPMTLQMVATDDTFQNEIHSAGKMTFYNNDFAAMLHFHVLDNISPPHLEVWSLTEKIVKFTIPEMHDLFHYRHPYLIAYVFAENRFAAGGFSANGTGNNRPELIQVWNVPENRIVTTLDISDGTNNTRPNDIVFDEQFLVLSMLSHPSKICIWRMSDVLAAGDAAATDPATKFVLKTNYKKKYWTAIGRKKLTGRKLQPFRTIQMRMSANGGKVYDNEKLLLEKDGLIVSTSSFETGTRLFIYKF